MKTTVTIFFLALLPNILFAEGQSSAGLPQMEVSLFPSQIFWLIITFGILYLFMWRIAIPKISNIIEERQDKIANDIDEAESLNKEAEKILNDYEIKIQEASKQAHNMVIEAKSKADTMLDNVKKEQEIKINKLLEESRIKLQKQELNSKANIEQAAIETVKLISLKFIKTLPTDDNIKNELN